MQGIDVDLYVWSKCCHATDAEGKGSKRLKSHHAEQVGQIFL